MVFARKHLIPEVPKQSAQRPLLFPGAESTLPADPHADESNARAGMVSIQVHLAGIGARELTKNDPPSAPRELMTFSHRRPTCNFPPIQLAYFQLFPGSSPKNPGWQILSDVNAKNIFGPSFPNPINNLQEIDLAAALRFPESRLLL